MQNSEKGRGLFFYRIFGEMRTIFRQIKNVIHVAVLLLW